MKYFVFLCYRVLNLKFPNGLYLKKRFPSLKNSKIPFNHGWCLANPGSFYLIYVDKPSTFSIRLYGSEYKGEWGNAANTLKRIDFELVVSGKDITTPASGDDWFLLIKK